MIHFGKFDTGFATRPQGGQATDHLFDGVAKPAGNLTTGHLNGGLTGRIDQVDDRLGLG